MCGGYFYTAQEYDGRTERMEEKEERWGDYKPGQKRVSPTILATGVFP